MLPIPRCWVPEGGKPSTEQGGCSNDVQKDEKCMEKIHGCTLQDFFDKVSIKSLGNHGRNSDARCSNCVLDNLSRSEERRVGKECRFWWSRYHNRTRRV